LTLSSLFLCGYVVQYIATADNYKAALEKSEKAKGDLKVNLDTNIKKLQQATDDKQRIEDGKNKEIDSLKQEKSSLENKIRELELVKSELDTKVQGWVSIVDQLTKLTDKHRTQFETTFEELSKAKGELITEKKKLDEATSALMQKEAMIDMLEGQTKRLTEEKMVIENRLNRTLQPVGRKVQAEKTAVPEKDLAQQAAAAATTEIGLKARITGVDLKNSMAKLSIGSTDGVKKGMKFHVSRGNDFICDILIIDVSADEAVGMLELVQQDPRIGDNASTNL
jgi:chromosome segregation ATPase